ncbi:hypothetical protein THRCLA_21688 [Thraustotheca clavata]|uniref:Uncharacterized protein n=1 Tax=Thraustotheca clavata TaxID=74557 RepID=A0A1V9ZQT7_9STRA|nr:hypothetical protein THRCLA_21688 [Thraustotheca clavata]
MSDEWRCRYKTGKCDFPRAIKYNKKTGAASLLLLCERHRRLQNKTKKRSDTKYKHDRAMLRVLKRLSPKQVESLEPFTPSELEILAYYLL